MEIRCKEEKGAGLKGGMYICRFHATMEIEYISEGLKQLLGEEESLLTAEMYMAHILEEDRASFEQYILKASKSSSTLTCAYRIRRGDGETVSVLERMEFRTCEDKIRRGYASVTDVTEQKMMEENYDRILKREKYAQSRFHELLKFARMLFFEYKKNNAGYTALENLEAVGFPSLESFQESVDMLKSEDDTSWKTLGEAYFLLHEKDKKTARKCAEKLSRDEEIETELRFLCGDGKYHWFEVHTSVSEENPDIVRGFMRNIDARHDAFEHLRRKTLIDPMTGVLNKVEAFEQIKKYMHKNPEACNALLFMDIDDFKKINDVSGHETGDQVIKSFVRIVQSIFRKDDIIARFGGDEFVVFMKNISGKECAFRRAEEIISRCKNCHELQSCGMCFSVSIGIAFSEGRANAGDLVLEADKMLYAAKAEHKGTVCGKR